MATINRWSTSTEYWTSLPIQIHNSRPLRTLPCQRWYQERSVPIGLGSWVWFHGIQSYSQRAGEHPVNRKFPDGLPETHSTERPSKKDLVWSRYQLPGIKGGPWRTIEVLDNLEKATLKETATKNGTRWTWRSHPGNSPQRDGAAEAAMRIVKKALNWTALHWVLAVCQD